MGKSLARGCSSGTDTRFDAFQQAGGDAPRAMPRDNREQVKMFHWAGSGEPRPPVVPPCKRWPVVLGFGAAVLVACLGAAIPGVSYAQEHGGAAGISPDENQASDN